MDFLFRLVLLSPGGKLVSFNSFFMCGFPGGIDYFLMVFVKYDYIHKLTEKRINRWLNLVIRYPHIFFVVYLILLNASRNTFSAGLINYSFLAIMCILQFCNVLYYCDKVVGNYHVNKYIKINNE